MSHRCPQPSLTGDHDWIVRNTETLLSVLDRCNITTIVNLDGMWEDELEANLDRYDRAYPSQVLMFAPVDWSLVTGLDFGSHMARQLEDLVWRGAPGLTVWKRKHLRLTPTPQ